MKESTAINYVNEWITKFSQSEFELAVAPMLVASWESSKFEINIAIHDHKFYLYVVDKIIDSNFILSFPEDIQSVCALLSYLVDGVPLTFNLQEHQELTNNDIAKLSSTKNG